MYCCHRPKNDNGHSACDEKIERLTSELSQVRLRTVEISRTSTLASQISAERVISRKTPPLPDTLNDVGELMTTKQYVLIKEIAFGSSGVVYEGLNTVTNRSVAIKRIRLSKTNARVSNEIKLLLELRQHPFIIELLDCVIEDHLVYMVFPLWRGPIMKMEVEPQPPLSEKLARRFVRQIYLALEFLHSHNIVHRDIKPENVLMSDKGGIQLADLGVSAFCGDITSFRGTRIHQAPEVFTDTEYGAVQDMWSLGTTAYCILTGMLPFYHVSPYILMIHIRDNEPDYSQLENRQREFIQSLLKKSPDLRATGNEVRRDKWITRDGENLLPDQRTNINMMKFSETTFE